MEQGTHQLRIEGLGDGLAGHKAGLQVKQSLEWVPCLSVGHQLVGADHKPTPNKLRK